MKKILMYMFLTFLLFANEQTYKITYLMVYAKDNPSDVKSREILLKHFYKINDKKNILRYSVELHSLDPKNKVLASILKELDMRIKHRKITETLKNFIKNKQYIRYLNLYQALVDTKTDIAKNFHIDALYSAVMSDNYKLAKKILKRDDLPMSPHLTNIMRILDKKLGNDTSL
jgi:hypothetical protein